MFRKTCAALALAAALPAAHAAFPERPITLIVPLRPAAPPTSWAAWRRPRPARSWASRSWWKTAPARPAPSAWPRPRAKPDGYTVGLATVSTHGTAPHLFPNLAYDPVRISRRSAIW